LTVTTSVLVLLLVLTVWCHHCLTVKAVSCKLFYKVHSNITVCKHFPRIYSFW